jgi:hypothetical protein
MCLPGQPPAPRGALATAARPPAFGVTVDGVRDILGLGLVRCRPLGDTSRVEGSGIGGRG